ncbi:single-stranded-DNA-specific exonuclease RecJ [Proteinivorax tanatarense]|uniref:Single-stranded-DNA-specific exonuclease RecJ n=1 Tax=Proteinivorax tanatarense TaxID=1260629 RepID=A0AAU7VPN8_9FIRM
MDKKWVTYNPCAQQAKTISEQYGISMFLAKLLVNRDVKNIDEFLNPKITNLHNPKMLLGSEESVKRIVSAIEKKEKILIFGDYDVDGITSTAVLFSGLKEVGAELLYHIPIRTEGYGLNKDTLQNYIEQGVTLVITVDCGISAFQEVEFLKNAGVDCIITDHHTPGEVVPDAFCIVNPKQDNCNYPFKELAGVGLAFKLTQAVFQYYKKDNWDKFIDIVALGTVADLVPLVGENRTIVSLGLERMNSHLRPNFKWLAEVSGVSAPIDSYHLGFAFGPRLNAAGRVNDPNQALKLLLCDNEKQGVEIATNLNEQNKCRQELEKEIYKQAVEKVEKMDMNKTKVIVLGDSSWHKGVIGIVASRLVEKYYRPVIILSIDKKEKIATGSSRSVEGFHLYKALQQASHLLEKFGGHAMAAGLSIEINKIEQFRNEINCYAKAVEIDKHLIPKLPVDFTLNPSELDLCLVDEVELLKPFGQENPAPAFVVENLPIANYKLVGKDRNHLKVSFNFKGNWINSIGFKKDYLLDTVSKQDKINVLGYIEKNHYKDKTSLQLKILDLKGLTTDESDSYPLDLRGRDVLKYIQVQESNNHNKEYGVLTNEYYKTNTERYFENYANVSVIDYEQIFKYQLQQKVIVLLHPPCTQMQFRDILAHWGEDKLIIGFKEEKIKLLPTKQFLRFMYTVMRKESSRVGLDLKEVTVLMKLDKSSSYLAHRGLNILVEHDLLKEHNGRFYFNEKGPSNVDIEQGRIFKKYQKQQQVYEKWFQLALTTSLDNLIKSQMFIDEEEKVWI